MNLSNISGHYVYRSLHNKASIEDEIKFGEGLMTIIQKETGNFTGDFDMGGDYIMKLEGTMNKDGTNIAFKMTGKGVENTPTEGWIYDYQGIVTPNWPNGINQLTTITGSVIRTVDHGNAKAGYTATFYMVMRDKHTDRKKDAQ